MRGAKIVLVLFLSGLSAYSSSAKAQVDVDVNLSGDLVSSYVWRGAKAAGTSVQPTLSVSAAGFTLGSWASMDIAGNNSKEVDFFASYSKGGFALTVTDYWWDGEGAYRYFSSPDAEGAVGHQLEAGLAYTLSESFPLTLSWNTFVMGIANKKANGDNSFSTYVEASYPFSVKGVDMKAAVGLTPWESAIYGTKKFSVTNILVGASKEVKITDSFSVPIFANIIANPFVEDIHFVFGITIK